MRAGGQGSRISIFVTKLRMPAMQSATDLDEGD